MGLSEAPNPPHPYPQELQLKLYQAFIFSIPILFSIILFLLFYLFYLKRRATSLSSPPQILPRSSNQSASYISSVSPLYLSHMHYMHEKKREKKKEETWNISFFLWLCCGLIYRAVLYSIMFCCWSEIELSSSKCACQIFLYKLLNSV